MSRVEVVPDSQRSAYAPSTGTHQMSFSLPSSGKLSHVALRGKFYLAQDPGVNDVAIPGAVGLQTAIDQLQVVAADGTVLEDLQHYARTIGCLYQASMSTPDGALTSVGSREMITGNSESAKLALKGCVAATPYYFSLRLHSGLLAQNINLSRWGGARVHIRLAQDANVISGLQASSAYAYSLADVKLCAKLSEEDPNAAKSQVVFPTIYTVKNAIRGGRSINTVSVPAAKCLSAFQSYLLSSYDGNFLYNATACQPLPGLSEVKFTLGGASFPAQFPLRGDSSDAEIMKGFLEAASGKMRLADGDSELVATQSNLGTVRGTGVSYAEMGGVDLSSRKFGIEVVSSVTAGSAYSVWSHFRVLASA